MCGRFRQRLQPEVLVEVFDLDAVLPFPGDIEIFPKKYAIVVREDKNSNKREAASLYWSLLPGWHQKEPKEFKLTTFNATAEKVSTSPVFRDSFKKRRCLVPAQCWFEYIGEKGAKRAVNFRMVDDAPFAMAGIWDRNEAGTSPLESFSIITTSANDFVKPYHHRMPVLIQKNDYAEWLDPKQQEGKKLQAFLAPCAPELLKVSVDPPSVKPKKVKEETPSLFGELE